jgi:hypothetical protein
MDKFNLKQLSDMEVKEQYRVKTSNRFAALENFDDDDDDVDISRSYRKVLERT